MKKKLYLSDALVRKYKNVNKVNVAKAANCSPKWARDVLGGKELITGKAAQLCIKEAERLHSAT